MPTDNEPNQHDHPDHDDPEHEIYDDDLQLISAFLDNQLSPDEKLAFKKRLLQEPKLNEQCHRFAALDAEVKTAVSSIDDTPMPEKLDQLLEEDDPNHLSPTKVLQWAAVIGAVGLLSWYDFNATDSNQNPATLVVDNALSQALSNQPALTLAKLDQQRQFIVSQTFYHTSGLACREYNLSDLSHTTHAIACHNGSNWQIMINNKQAIVENNNYQTASNNNDKIAEYLQRSKVSRPLSTQQEAQMIKANWVKPKTK